VSRTLERVQDVAVHRLSLAAGVTVVSFGLTALFAVLGLDALVPVTFVLGVFLLTPLVLLFGGDIPFVPPADEDTNAAATRGRTERSVTAETPTDVATPVERLQEQYARGELSEAEFERRLETAVAEEPPGPDTSTGPTAPASTLDRDHERSTTRERG
jgi:hypothetical protein